MRQQIRKPKKQFVLRGSTCETFVVTNVEHESLPRLITDCRKIAHRIAAQERLREPPDLGRERELMWQRMRNRERLAVLSAPNGPIDEFVYKRIRVVVVSLQIAASCISCTAGRKVSDWLNRGKQLNSRVDRRFHYIDQAATRFELRRTLRSCTTSFNLHLANGSQCRWRRNCGSSWIRFDVAGELRLSINHPLRTTPNHQEQRRFTRHETFGKSHSVLEYLAARYPYRFSASRSGTDAMGG